MINLYLNDRKELTIPDVTVHQVRHLDTSLEDGGERISGRAVA